MDIKGNTPGLTLNDCSQISLAQTGLQELMARNYELIRQLMARDAFLTKQIGGECCQRKNDKGRSESLSEDGPKIYSKQKSLGEEETNQKSEQKFSISPTENISLNSNHQKIQLIYTKQKRNIRWILKLSQFVRFSALSLSFLQKVGLPIQQFQQFVEKKVSSLNSLHQIQEMWNEEGCDQIKAFRILSHAFIRRNRLMRFVEGNVETGLDVGKFESDFRTNLTKFLKIEGKIKKMKRKWIHSTK